MTIAMWRVWSPRPPECLERVSCASMFDAARAWADRQAQRGMMAHDGIEVLACCEGDAAPQQSTYRLRIRVVTRPAFRAEFRGLAFEGDNGEGSP